jgi:IclR family KDG regulon transcriptional repressor
LKLRQPREREATAASRVTAADPASTAIKAVTVLELLASTREGLGLSEIVRRIGSSRTSALRIVNALVAKGLVVQDPEKKRYGLTLRLLELGTQVLDQMDLHDMAKPHLERLSQRAGETAHLGVLDGWDVIFIGKAEPADPFHMHARVGWRAPSHCTSLGKALLAALPDAELQRYLSVCSLAPLTPNTITSAAALADHLRAVRAQGFAVDAEEHRLGICCIGAPIRRHGGDVAAAVSISGPAFRLQGDRLQAMAEWVRETAEAISRDLGAGVRRP